MPEETKAVVRELFEAFDAGDLERAVSLVTDDFELVDFAAGTAFQPGSRTSYGHRSRSPPE